MILRDILVLTCITAAAAELEWHRLRNEIRYPTAMREAMDACACTGSPTLWQNRRGVLKNAKNKKAKHAHDKLCHLTTTAPADGIDSLRLPVQRQPLRRLLICHRLRVHGQAHGA